MCVAGTGARAVCILIALGLAPRAAALPPQWYGDPEGEYPRGEYIVGVGAGTAKDKNERMAIAVDNARSNLIHSIRTQISSELVDEQKESGQRLDFSLQSRIVASSALEVDGIRIALRRERGRTAYALAVLAKDEGRRLHAQKVAGLDRELARGFALAGKYAGQGDKERALQYYLGLYPLLDRREQAQAVLLALGDFTTDAFAALDELDQLEGDARIGRYDVDEALEYIKNQEFNSVDEAAAVMGLLLRRQLPSGLSVVVTPFTYGKTKVALPFSDYFSRAVGAELMRAPAAGLRTVAVTRGFEPRTSDHLRELGGQSKADIVVAGSYVEKENTLRVFAQALSVAEGTIVAVADVELDQGLVRKAGLGFSRDDYEDKLLEARVLGSGELLAGGLQVEVWTNRGAESLVLRGGDEVVLAVRANQPCFLQVVNHLADGKRALIYNNYPIRDGQVNRALALPDTFVIAAPYGVEVVQVFASTAEFPEVPTRFWQGYEIFAGDLTTYMERTRGFLKKKKARERGEARLTLTTIGP